jgi:hypothetical protein
VHEAGHVAALKSGCVELFSEAGFGSEEIEMFEVGWGGVVSYESA